MLGERLKLLRSENNLLQKDVALKLSITTSAFGFYEQNKRNPDSETLIQLADFFDVSIDWLVGRSDIRNPLVKSEYRDLDQVNLRPFMG